MGVPKRLTEMQQRFAEYVIFGGPDGPVSQAEAAKLAGYSHKRCRQEGSELMNPRVSPLVAKYIGNNLDTFSIGMPGSVELYYANQVAKFISSKHQTPLFQR